MSHFEDPDFNAKTENFLKWHLVFKSYDLFECGQC